MQMQPAAAVLDVFELELAGHVTQVDAAVAPVGVEYVFTAQLVHTAVPLAIL